LAKLQDSANHERLLSVSHFVSLSLLDYVWFNYQFLEGVLFRDWEIW